MAKKKNTTRADGRIAVQVFLGRDEQGKRRYKTVYGVTQKEANEKALQVKLAMHKGIDVTAERDTFGEWADRWLRLKKMEVAHSQYCSCVCTVKYLKQSVNNVPISKCRSADIQDVLTAIATMNPNTKKPSSIRTLQVIKNTAAQIFQLAIENRIMEYNPASTVKVPKLVEPSKRRALTEEEQKWINDTTHNAKTAAMLMMYAGLRRGELIPLTWADVDLKAKTVTVNKAAEVIRGKFVVKPRAKTEAGLRVIDIPDKLIAYLGTLKRTSVLVVTNTRGGMHTESSFRRMWGSYMKDLNIKYGDLRMHRKENGKLFQNKYDPAGVPMVIPPITPHWLRHTFITNMYLAGVDILTAQQQAGHANIETTLSIYTHLDAQHKRRSMDKLNVFLDGCKSTASHVDSSSPENIAE